MKRQKILLICKAVTFVLIGLFLFQTVNHVFMGKSNYAKYRNYQKQDDIDVMILGNSHAEAAFSPELMETMFKDEYDQDVSVFNYSISGMRIEHLAFFMEEALKKNTPNLIIIETFTFVPIAEEHREVLSRWAFDMLPLSKNKVEAIQYCATEDYWTYYIPFMVYHTRWKELTKEDIRLVYSEAAWKNYGEVLIEETKQLENVDDYFEKDVSDIDEIQAITDTERESIEKVIQLAEENNIQLLFVSVPYKQQLEMDSEELIKINNYLQETYVNGDNVQMLDLNRRRKELDFGYADLQDEGHCNINGAQKVTEHLMDYIIPNYKAEEIVH